MPKIHQSTWQLFILGIKREKHILYPYHQLINVTAMHHYYQVINWQCSHLKIGVILFAARVNRWALSLNIHWTLTSSGKGALAAALSSSSYLAIRAWSTWTSGGARAGAATNSRDWLLIIVSKWSCLNQSWNSPNKLPGKPKERFLKVVLVYYVRSCLSLGVRHLH